ncbi:MAG: quinolinate synthase NadA [Ignavibacteriaceae bacterium]|nr:quinolinate synthase NadA [Ignavibacteriaceae bacterium]
MFTLPEVREQKDLKNEILKLKLEKNAVILAHYYQEPEIQDLADFIGDSLELSRKAKDTDADMIVFCGVHFMAECAKILNPSKKVLIPDPEAGCSLADSCPAPLFKEFIENYPGHTVISYINCSAAVKALSDIIVTSSNAEKIVNQLPADEKIIFAPDRNLGRFIMKKTGRDMVLWEGTCIVHETFSLRKILDLKASHPGAKLIAHPECEAPVLSAADYIGSTSALLKYVQSDLNDSYIVATEPGIMYQMEKAVPHKTLIAAPPEKDNCNCNNCPYMKLNSLEKLYDCLLNEEYEIHMDEKLIAGALTPLERMLEMSR